MTAYRPWFEVFPELLAWELERFAHHGLDVDIDQGRRARGQLVLATTAAYRGSPVALTVAYPSEYPELPPVVYGPAGLLDRHQHAFGGNFCLLERPLDDWNAAEWGAADLIDQQLRSLLADSESGPEAVATREAPMPEPATAYFRYAPDAAVVVPGELSSPPGEGGALTIGSVTDHLYLVTAVDARRHNGLQATLTPAKTLHGRWVRLDRPPLVGDGDGPSLVGWLAAEHPELLVKKLPKNWVRQGKATAPPAREIVGLVFSEEGPGVGETRDAWLFVVIDRSAAQERSFLFHAQVLSEAERNRRIPELAGLGDRRALVLGGGSVGGDVAIELARAGVGTVDVIDYDRFEITNSVRHPLGAEYTGLPKAAAVALACRRANPYCDARPHHLRFGADDWLGDQAPAAVLTELVADADVVIDATGSHQIAQFASRLAAEADVPFLAGWMTDGFYGAEVVRIRPATTMCWTCFATAQREGQLPLAERGPERPVVVQGCSHPTVEGAGFDVAECAALLTRMAVATLAPAGGYGDLPYNYAAISFRHSPEDPDRQRMTTDDLAPDTDGCPRCQPAVGSTGAPIAS